MNQKGFSILIILLGVFITLGIVAVLYTYLNKTSLPLQTSPPVITVSQNIKNNSVSLPTSSPISIKEYITFTKPPGWKELPDERSNFLIYSSDSLGITIHRREDDDPKQAIDQVVHPLYPQESLDSDIQMTKVSGLDAVSFHYDFEGHSLTYVIAQLPNIVWQIDITSKNLATENMHRGEIDSFINSISIKK